MGEKKCAEHGSTLGAQNVKRIVIDKGLPYPRPGLSSVEGDASEIECPYCGLANDLSDEDGIVRCGDFECGHCGEWFEVEDVTVIARVSVRRG